MNKIKYVELLFHYCFPALMSSAKWKIEVLYNTFGFFFSRAPPVKLIYFIKNKLITKVSNDTFFSFFIYYTCRLVYPFKKELDFKNAVAFFITTNVIYISVDFEMFGKRLKRYSATLYFFVSAI